jgi:two-component system sensor histidine kinase and response regulator WspE
VASANLNHLVELAGESRILLRQLRSFVEEARMLVQAQRRMEALLGHWSKQASIDDGRRRTVLEMQSQWQAWRTQSLQHVSRLQDYDLRAGLLADRLYSEALTCRMRPFDDCLPALRRLVHDTGRQLGKAVRLVVSGESTQVDREILERLEGLFIHLLRNAVDHGAEPGNDRLAAGKAAEGTIRLAVRQFGGRLVVRVEDDGRGIDVDQVRRRAVAGNYVTAEAAGQLSPQEVLEFLFLPGFSLRDNVTEVSGRGVGLDAVQTAIRALRGSVRLSSTLGQGTRFEISVPISLSVARCLLVEIAGEPWAMPLSRLVQLLHVPAESVESIQGQPFVQAGHERIGLVQAAQVLGLNAEPVKTEKLSVMVISKGGHSYGLIVDRFLQQVELSVQETPAELGKLCHFSAVSVLADGSPVLLLDDEDLVSSIRSLDAAGQLRAGTASAPDEPAKSKRILVVEDSLTVRELERTVLAGCGYAVETATDGMDGWNKLRAGDFDLVITDVDMPRMDGIELVQQIRTTPRFHDLPVMIVTYKGRPEDRQRGLEAGADYYFTKSSFHNEQLVRVVEEIIGAAA